MKTVLSIDWDFWFLDRPEMDWGHKESPLFIELLWGVRASEIFRRGNTLLDFGLEGDEWGDLPSWLEGRGHTLNDALGLHIAESHGSAYHALNEHGPDEKYELINVDAHHDVMYELDPSKEVQCDNWILQLARDGKLSRVVQVYPAWRADEPEADHLADEVREELAALGVEYEVIFGLENLDARHIETVFFCRSGAWVPPWHDDSFIQAAEAWMMWAGTCHLWTRSSIEDFRRHFDEDAAHEMAEQMGDMLALGGRADKTA